MHLFFNSNPITSITTIYYTITNLFISIPILAHFGHLFQFHFLDLTYSMKEQGFYSSQTPLDAQNNT